VDGITLITPTLELADDFCAMATEFLNEGDERYRKAMIDVEAYVDRCAKGRAGVDLPPEHVPWSTFWLVKDRRRILGCSRLRHYLNGYLEQEGGHVGYDVRPSERRKGFATRLLRLTLEEARHLGLTRILITADSTNVPSWRVIEKNGGVLESETKSAETGELLRKYWIAL
jgi:predicted acetyltransferase